MVVCKNCGSNAYCDRVGKVICLVCDNPKRKITDEKLKPEED